MSLSSKDGQYLLLDERDRAGTVLQTKQNDRLGGNRIGRGAFLRRVKKRGDGEDSRKKSYAPGRDRRREFTKELKGKQGYKPPGPEGGCLTKDLIRSQNHNNKHQEVWR